MKKRFLKTCMALGLLVTMTAPIVGNINIHASEKIVDTFYILDEEGNPVVIETTQKDLDQAALADGSYKVIAKNEMEEAVMGEYDSLEEAAASYKESIEFFQSIGTYTNEENDIIVQIVDGEADVISTTENIIGIVRFKRDATTFDYIEVDSGRTGYLSPYTTGDAAYIRTEEDGIICKVAGATIKVAKDDIDRVVRFDDMMNNTVTDNKFSYYSISGGYLVHTYSLYSGSQLTTAATRVGYKPAYLENNTKYYSYDGHYFYKSFEKMIEDYRNGTFANSVNKDNPYYNYYQFLSLRTTSVFTPEQYNAHVASNKSSSKLVTAGGDFVEVQDTYVINSLVMFGIAINESAWGTSSLATTKNNLFGLKAVDADPYESADSFKSFRHCMEEYAYHWLQSGYLNGTNFRYHGPHLGDKHSGLNVKYASDPYWGEKGVARSYYIDSDKKDYGRFTIGIANAGIINLYKEPNASSKVIYTSESGCDGNLYDYPVVVLDTVKAANGEMFYKVISDMPLAEDRSERNVEAQYKPSRDYVYAKASDIDIIFTGSGVGTIIPDPTIDITNKEEPDPEPPVENEKTQEEVLNHLEVTKTDTYLTGFELGGDVSSEINKIKELSDKIQVTIKDKNGTQVTSGLLATGMTMAVTTEGTTKVYDVVIRGDVSGDGKISALDYVKVRNNLDGVTTLTGAYLKSADASGDGKVSALDYVKVRNHLDKKSTIVQ